MEFLEKTLETAKDLVKGVAKRVSSELDDVLESCLKLVFGLLELGPQLLKKAWALVFLTGTGLLLVYARKRFIASADGFAIVLPAILEGFNLVIKTVDLLIGTVGSIGKALSNLSMQRSVASEDYGSLFKTIPTINTENAAAWIREVPAQCEPYTSATSVLDGIIREAASPAVCPAMRRLYVVDWLYPWVYPIVDFFSLSYDPTPPFTGSENNCRPAGRAPRWECLAIGAGYVVLELILPLLLVSILFSAIGRPVFSLAGSLLSLTFGIGFIVVTDSAEALGNVIA